MTWKHDHESIAIKSCLALSVVVHLVFVAPLEVFKTFQLGAPVLQSQPIMVDLQEVRVAPSAQFSPLAAAAAFSPDSAPEVAGEEATLPAEEPASQTPGTATAAAPVAAASVAAPEPAAVPTPAPVPTPNPVATQVIIPAVLERSAGSAASRSKGQTVQVAAGQANPALPPALPPLRTPDEFLTSDWEKLCYRISMWGIPVGSAELEAKQEKGEVRITMHIRSNASVSELYPVDDSVETRHIGGNFIITRIRQREGSFQGDRGFTLFLRDKSVFWIDLLKNLSFREPLPNNGVVDILSGLYYFRNQPLEVGQTVVLQLFDSNRYAPTTVAVLRKEHLKLPGLREADTLLVHPQLKTDGLFRRTGDILIWLTDDRKRVPVKVETRISLGKVTAELVSAETHRRGEAPPGVPASGKPDQGAPFRTAGQVASHPPGTIGSADSR